jgi:hypothetical protein
MFVWVAAMTIKDGYSAFALGVAYFRARLALARYDQRDFDDSAFPVAFKVDLVWRWDFRPA